MLEGTAVMQLCQMGCPVPGCTSLVRERGLAIAVEVECFWCSHVEAFQHTLSAHWAPTLVAGSTASCSFGGSSMVVLFGGVLRQSAW